MSTQEADRFIGTVQDDPVLRSAVEAAGLDERGQELVALAKAYGFDCTVEELRERLAAADTELTSRQLDQVAGGIGEMQSLTLQNVTDERQKILSTLSNIMKRIGSAMETTTQNLK
jgi:predicted ribosomally synthesized peptide with nif11-like leader